MASGSFLQGTRAAPSRTARAGPEGRAWGCGPLSPARAVIAAHASWARSMHNILWRVAACCCSRARLARVRARSRRFETGKTNVGQRAANAGRTADHACYIDVARRGEEFRFGSRRIQLVQSDLGDDLGAARDGVLLASSALWLVPSQLRAEWRGPWPAAASNPTNFMNITDHSFASFFHQFRYMYSAP